MNRSASGMRVGTVGWFPISLAAAAAWRGEAPSSPSAGRNVAVLPAEDTRRQKRRGAMAVLAAILMIAMMGFLALAVDLGYVMTVRTELQRATDDLEQVWQTAAGAMYQSAQAGSGNGAGEGQAAPEPEAEAGGAVEADYEVVDEK